VVRRGHQATAGVAQVEAYLTKLCASRSELSTLMISSAAEDLTALFYRRGSDRMFVLILTASQTGLEQAVREFFARRGISPLQSYPIPRQEGGGLGCGLVFPLPALVAEASRVTGELLRVVCQEEAPDFHFRYYHVVRY
jgi:hypothetical protein